MRQLPTEHLHSASIVTVTRCESVLVRSWWNPLRKIPKLRAVTRIVKDRCAGETRILKQRRLTVFETTIYEDGDIMSYDLTYKPTVQDLIDRAQPEKHYG